MLPEMSFLAIRYRTFSSWYRTQDDRLVLLTLLLQLTGRLQCPMRCRGDRRGNGHRGHLRLPLPALPHIPPAAGRHLPDGPRGSGGVAGQLAQLPAQFPLPAQPDGPVHGRQHQHADHRDDHHDHHNGGRTGPDAGVPQVLALFGDHEKGPKCWGISGRMCNGIARGMSEGSNPLCCGNYFYVVFGLRMNFCMFSASHFDLILQGQLVGGVRAAAVAPAGGARGGGGDGGAEAAPTGEQPPAAGGEGGAEAERQAMVGVLRMHAETDVVGGVGRGELASATSWSSSGNTHGNGPGGSSFMTWHPRP